jgi:hypothetical protein
MEKDEVQLENGIKIRKVRDQELASLAKNEIFEFRIRNLNVTYENVLEIASSSQFPAGAFDIMSKKENVLTTLRLFKEGHLFIDLSIPQISHGSLKSEIRGVLDSFAISMSSFEPLLYTMQKPHYSLRRSETDRLTGFHCIISKTKLSLDLGVAVSWFNQALETPDSLDCLIKHVTALEALYLEGGPELTYRLSHCVSSFLGRSPVERLEINHWIREFYNMRSKIIHGGKRGYIIPVEYLSKLEEYVRLSIVKMIALRQRYKRNRLAELIEESIYDDKNRLQLDKETEEFYGFGFQ